MSVPNEERVEMDFAFSTARLIADEAPNSIRKPTGSSVSEPIRLIVDDDPTVRTLWGAVLKGRGLATLQAADSGEGLAIVHSLEGRLNLIITDILMPGEMDGVDLAHAIRQRFPTIPVILTSGYSDQPKMLASGFPFITKPFQSTTMWNVIEGVMAREGEGSPTTA